uniref:Uncharacterized protein n=1 Tax=Triticum urartu TaxID=4572 RepID=A0A8R7PWD8_TRIUA
HVTHPRDPSRSPLLPHGGGPESEFPSPPRTAPSHSVTPSNHRDTKTERETSGGRRRGDWWDGAARACGAAADRGPDEPAGAILQAPRGALQEGVRARGPLRRRGRAARLLPRREALRVRLLQ